jgi:two-component system LytT family sensor kinase
VQSGSGNASWPGWRAWVALCGAALLLSLVEAAQTYVRSTIGGPPVHWIPAIGNALPFWLLLALLTPLVVMLARRWPLDGPRPGRAVGVHFAGAALFVLVHAISITAVNVTLLAWPVSPRIALSKILSFASVIDVLVYGAIVGATHALSGRPAS